MFKQVNTMWGLLLLGTLALPVEAQFARCDEVCSNPNPFMPTEVQCNTACTLLYPDLPEHGLATTCEAATYDCTRDTGGGSGGGDGGSDGGGGGESTAGVPGYGDLLSRAPGTRVWQSSTAWGGDASRAVDYNYDGNWASGSVTHTDINVRPEWRIHTDHNVYRSVRIFNRTDCCSERLGGASVWVHHWDTKSQTYKWRQVATIGKNPGREIHISFLGKLPNHYADALRIMLPEGSKVPLSLAEVELWGCLGDPQRC